MNGSDYKDASELQVVTLENAIYLSMKNDVAYVLHDELFLYEQQSTKNANMPLRCLFYASDTYSVLVKDKNIYGTKMLPPSSPTFVVFYNGKQKMDEEGELRLSDAFVKKQENPNLEVIVKVKNINMGNSRELFEKCRPMRDYMIFVDKVRRYSQEQTLEDAVEQTIRECMEEDVMADFLKRNRAEVVKMCLYEYDEEKQREFDREEGKQELLREQVQKNLEKGYSKAMRIISVGSGIIWKYRRITDKGKVSWFSMVYRRKQVYNAGQRP